MKRLTGKVAFITGASSGIGAALARELGDQGASVALLARRAERLRALAAEIRAAGGHALAIPCDVTREGDLERAVSLTVAGLGPIDIVVANAGFGVVGALDTLRSDDYRRQFETNVFGVLHTIYATLDQLRRSRGTLVILGSVSGYIAAPSASPYAMSKFAVRALAEALHAELAPKGISVVLISPGFVDSEIRRVDNWGRLHPNARDPVPRRLRMPSHHAARKIVRALARRRRERVITAHGKLAVFLARHTPRLMAFLLRHGRRTRREPA
jgi:short-subunit dehydrogenase